jgi:hypothetical protein
MIGLYSDDGSRLPMAYRGLTINDDTYPVDSVTVDPRWDSVTEPLAERDGMEAYDPRRIAAMVRVDGFIRASSIAQLHDRIEALNAAFDPVLARDADSADRNRGYLPFTFSVPTEDVTNYPDGLIPMQYHGRSIALPVPRVSKFEGHSVPFTILLQAVDPRRYLQTLSSLTLTSAVQELDNSLASYKSWPVVRLTMSGAGIVDWVVNNSSDDRDFLVLDLTGRAAGQVVEIDMQARTIKIDDTVDMSIYVSGEYFDLAPDVLEVGISSVAGIASCVIEWRRAFV